MILQNGNNPAPDKLPPNSFEIEVAALSCIVEAGLRGTLTEVDEQLRQLRPNYFYDLRNRELHGELVAMRMAGHAIDFIITDNWLKTHKKDSLLEFWRTHFVGTELPGMSFFNFPNYLDTLKKFTLRRWALAESVRLQNQASTGDIDVADLRAEFSEALEKIDKASDRERPLLEIVTIEEIKAHVPDPKMFILGEGMVSMGELTVIAGLPGLGKSRLANTFAFAGAQGNGEWMGYLVRRQYRTLVLQSENSMERMKGETLNLPESVSPWVRFSKNNPLLFSSPDFRQAVRRYYEQWPFDVIVIDPWSDVVRDEKFSDYQEGLENVMASLPGGDKRPAVVIVAHLKKAILGDKRMSGRQLMGQVSGSMRLMQKARTAFMLQGATDDITDARVIFDCGKCNNGQPLPMSAWMRCNGAFLALPAFDFDEWLSPAEESNKKITEDVMKKLFDGNRKVLKKILAKELMDLGHSSASAYRALEEKGKFGPLLSTDAEGFVSWKG